MKKPAWSYSSINLFRQCPKKYFHLKVVKDVTEPKTESILYGELVHKAAEEYIRDGKPIPESVGFIEPTIKIFKDLPGEKHCELKMGVTERGDACGFFDKEVWLRGVADLVVVNGEKAKIVDYKTGKSSKYADTKQLDLMALCTFAKFPEVKEISAGLAFLVCNDLVKRKYTRDDVLGILREWTAEYSWLSKSYDENVWNAKPNFSCRSYCAVTSCPHNGRGEH